MKTVEASDNPVVNSDEQLFTFGTFQANVNGETHRCPLTESIGPDVSYSKFVGEFDVEARSKVEEQGSNSNTTSVEKETDNIIKFSSTGGVMTETATKQIIERMTHFDPQHEPTEKQKETAKQACTIAKELGWDDVIPDEDDRHWYELN